MGDEPSVDIIHGILQADRSLVYDDVLLSLFVDENGGTCFPLCGDFSVPSTDFEDLSQ